MIGGCKNLIEVRIPQDEWRAHLGAEKAEQLMVRVKEGHRVRVRIYQPCNACYGCTIWNVGLSGVIGGSEAPIVEDRGRSGPVERNEVSSSGGGDVAALQGEDGGKSQEVWREK